MVEGDRVNVLYSLRSTKGTCSLRRQVYRLSVMRETPLQTKEKMELQDLEGGWSLGEI